MSKRTGRTGSKNKISSRIGVITVICCLALLAEEKEEYMKTDEYVEDVARSQLGLVYPDEIVIKPKE